MRRCPAIKRSLQGGFCLDSDYVTGDCILIDCSYDMSSHGNILYLLKPIANNQDTLINEVDMIILHN